MPMSNLRYCAANAAALASLFCMLAGGAWTWLCFPLAALPNSLGDEFFGEDLSGPQAGDQPCLDAQLVLALPLMALNTLVFACYFTSGDPLGVVALLQVCGVDFDAARASTGAPGYVSMIMGMGGFTGAAMTVAHELIHRTTRPGLVQVGRWLSAFCWESAFNLQHMVGHHMNAGFYEDSGTARRGENIYEFVVRASVYNNLTAIRSESDRLRRRNIPFFSIRNQFLTGQAMTLAIAAVYMAIAGWLGLAVFFIVHLQGRFYLEGAAYLEHYGLVRVPGTRFEPRHAWDTYRALSCALLFNLQRHSDHHQNATRPFYQLSVQKDAPRLPAGYLSLLPLAMVPPLWFAFMRPRLEAWDRERATPQELSYLAEHSAQGIFPVAAE